MTDALDGQSSDSTQADIPILYEDEFCVAIDKPPGLLVHRTRLDTLATEFALQRVRDRTGKRVYPVHRLDRATSGVLIFGFDSESARLLTEQFASRAVTKTYTAFVRGFCDPVGTIDLPLRDRDDAKLPRRPADTERESVTRYRTLSRYELPFSDGRHATSRYSLLELTPGTGRRHQIRRHLKHAAHPILGDTTHGDHRHNKRLAARLGLGRMLLVANRLIIGHPAGRGPLSLVAPLGEEFDRLLASVSAHQVDIEDFV